MLKGSNRKEALSFAPKTKPNTYHQSPQHCAHVRQSHMPILVQCAKEQPPKPPSATFCTQQAMHQNAPTSHHYTQTLPAATQQPTHVRVLPPFTATGCESVSQFTPKRRQHSTPVRLGHSDARLWRCGAQKNTPITETALCLPATSPYQHREAQHRPQVLLHPDRCSCSCSGACQHPCQLCSC